MITAHPSAQLQATTHYAIAWFSVLAVLIGLSVYSGKTAVGIALGIIIAAALVLVANGTIGPPHE